MIESPQSFIVSTECQKAAERHGFRRRLREENGWAAFQSTTAQGTIWLASGGVSGPWFLALDHGGVIEEIRLNLVPLDGPGLARFRFEDLRELYEVLPQIYGLAASLPDRPLRTFQTKVRDLPSSTEAERLIVQRIGQNIFRESLMDYWQGRCPLTGITDPALLRASHIVPWSECESDADRLDVHNGLLLSALWDAAFDRGLVTFADDGEPMFSSELSESGRTELRWHSRIPLTNDHRFRLAQHRARMEAQS
ncbi:HNH endonuclease [uncultured Roseobacter sp.]|uniref:HNH endonuclease n=1 Tax=uncultured Roseobacter sp. TaxID=114847 RepID=UPI00260688A4|nr:HNH endonuclease [uncultured Roseobacter sp.]